MSFEALGLHASLVKAVAAAGYTKPTPVQEQAIPAGIAGRDLLVSSQTGSGKTAAFMLPALNKLANMEPAPQAARTPAQNAQSARARGERVRFTPAQPKMLVLTPTRELALQVTTATEQYTSDMRRIRAVSILGGMPYPKQMQLLSKNPEILVATPGRLIDHMESGKINFSQLEILVLDEADRMLDMGFIEDIEKIVEATPDSRQTMLFSATLDGVVGNMARRITKDPLVIQIASATNRHENIVQKVHFVDDLSHKNRLLDHLLRDESLDQAVVFTATKRDADMIADRLNIAGFAAAALHGDMHQGARNRTLDSLRRGQVRVLVATDVAARGIDVPNITHVVNYDLPKFPEDYVHRIGRTGRAGRNGIAISLVNHAENMNVRRIERFTKQSIPVDVVEGFEPKRAAPTRSASRPGWKPGDGRNAHKPGQRSFAKPGYGDRAPREGGYGDRPQREGGYGDRAPREAGYARPAESRYADRGPREAYSAPREGGYGDRPQREGGYRRDAAPTGAPREGGYRGNRPEGARYGEKREGGYSKSAHPRSADGARRTFGDY
ncbi:DEAD/DEAH box helicase [Massilia sp. IC2-477]|uniref:DEAD/DEAH box helicase n=1 Tax=unclassified Massilia TaxID=2609279 RepID=UPI001D10D9A5|nr:MULTISPECIES: DEAD/DEAH box helicase [unclassified Massilia]MCC2956239.1 DEAD/DEAH box helicase [Massilia sp. IC2-477]MCC2972390.1 DEAD/DEAH box helicase [Massilia sp. IC2-476]